MFNIEKKKFVAKLHRRHFIISFPLVFYKKREKMKSKKFIEFIYSKGPPKHPKQLQNNGFVLYLPKRIRLQPGEFKHLDMKVTVWMPEEIVAVGAQLLTLSKNRLKLEDFQYILQAITFAVSINLSTYRGKDTLIWQTEPRGELFLQYSETKNSCSSLHWTRE